MTPTQIALHEAHKARQLRFAIAADRQKWNEQARADAVITARLETIHHERRRLYETRKRYMDATPIVPRILAAVAAEFGLSVADLTGPLRKAVHCNARFVAVGLLVEMTRISLPAIGRHLGNRDHTTILHAREQAKKLFASEAFRNRVDQIKAGLQ